MKLKHQPENHFELLGSGTPDAYYHEDRRSWGAAVFVGAVVTGFYFGITHAGQVQDLLQTGFQYVQNGTTQLLG